MDLATAPPLPVRPGTALSRVRRWLVGCGVGVSVAIIAVVGLIGALTQVALPIPGGLASGEQALRQLFGPDATIRLGAVEASWPLIRGPTVEVRDVHVEEAGRGVIDIPHVTITLDPWRLAFAQPVVRTLTVHAPRIQYAETQAGAAGPAAPGTAQPPEAFAGAEALSAIVADVVTALVPLLTVAESGIETIKLQDGVLEISRTTPGGKRRWQMPDIDGEISVSRSGAMALSLTGQGVDGRWRLAGDRLVYPDGRSRLTLEAADLLLADWVSDPGPHMGLGTPLYPALTADIDADGSLSAATATLGIGKGVVQFGPMPTDRIMVDQAEVRLGWQSGDQHLTLTSARLVSGQNRYALTGTLHPPRRGASAVWEAKLALAGGQLAPEGVVAPPLVLTGGAVTVRLDPVTQRLSFNDARLSWGSGTMTASGAMDFARPFPSLILDMQLPAMSGTEVKQAWPSWVAPPARTWFFEHADGGRAAAGGRIRLDLDRLDSPATWSQDAIGLDFRYEGLQLLTFGDLPPLTQMVGGVVIKDRKLSFQIDRADLVTATGRKANVVRSEFALDDVIKPVPQAVLRLQTQGETAVLAEIANAEPIVALKDTGLDPPRLSGQAQAQLTAEFALEADIRPEKAKVRAEIQLDSFGSSVPIEGRKVQNGKLKVLVEGTSVRVTGKAQVDGLAIDLDVQENRANGGGDRRGFKVVLDDEARRKLGADLGDLVRGRTPVTLAQGTDGAQRIEADLSQARLQIPVFAWTKGAGVPAKASFTLVSKEGQGGRLDNLQIESEGLDVRGSLQFDARNQVTRVDLSRFALRRGDDARIRFNRGAAGGEVTFEVGTFDLRGVIQGLKRGRDEPGGDPQNRDVTLNVRAARLIGFNNTQLLDTVVEAVQRKGVIQKLTLTGRIGGGRSVEARISTEGTRRTLAFTTDDLGTLLRFLDIYDQLDGGRARISAQMSGAGQSKGRLVATDFRVNDAKTARRLTAEVSRDARVDDNGLAFDKMAVEFTLQRGQISIDDAVLRGAAVGAIATGQIDLDRGRMMINGTYIPAYGLNNLIARIPIIGDIAAGGRNEGILGVTFRITGPVAEPVLEINPMSAIAPGIFRKIFEFRDSPGPAPAPARAD